MLYREIITILTLILYVAVFPYFIFMLLTSVAALCAPMTRRAQRDRAVPVIPRKRFVVVIPAHNEESGVVATVQSCLGLSYPQGLFQVLVIADNCTDQTASAAQKAGARVIERFDPTRKSKGHAIEFLIDALSRNGELATLDALVVVDADSTVHPRLLERFAEGLERGDEWIQCYDGVGNASESWRTRLIACGFSLINGVVLRGQSALGLSAGLRGNGMCLSTRGLSQVPWTAHGLTEDLEYSWLVRIAGGRIGYADDVAVYATMLVHGGEPAVVQRSRWEHGRRALTREMLGPLLKSPRLGWKEKIVAAVELTMPTISTLLCSYLVLTTLAVISLFWHDARSNPTLFQYSIGFCLAVTTAGMFLHAATPFLLGLIPLGYVSSFLYIPYYVVWKAIFRFRRKPTTWTRTPREFASGLATSVRTDDVKTGANC
jgi:cellulose synthase/poly-beta-1,6-N-acetylglucosamine synthase-like glycosyltransferase